jgi:hypothetical protein
MVNADSRQGGKTLRCGIQCQRSANAALKGA